jgi:hypothetical protein
MSDHDSHVHTHALLRREACNGDPVLLDHGPLPILHYAAATGRVWVKLYYTNGLPVGGRLVVDGDSGAFGVVDWDGQHVVSLPATSVRFLTEAEADECVATMVADAALHAAAHG